MFQDPLINAFATLIIVVGVVALLLFLVKKYSGKFTGPSFSGKKIKIETKQALSSKSFLYIIQVEGKRFLIGANDNDISKITELTDYQQINKSDTEDTNQIIQNLPNEIKQELSFSNFIKQSFFKKN